MALETDNTCQKITYSLHSVGNSVGEWLRQMIILISLFQQDCDFVGHFISINATLLYDLLF